MTAVQPRGARRLRRRALTETAAQLLGTPVGVALPVQRHPPHRILIACGVELAVFALLALTGSLVALAAFVVCSGALLALALTNTKRVLAVSRSGVAVLAADLRNHPLAPIGDAPAGLVLPEPRGIGVPVELADGRWWVDRVHFARLRRAGELRPPPTSASG